MNRNTVSRFDLAPQVDIQRSTFDRSCTCTTSMNASEIIPFYVEEILPGDSFDVKTSMVARLQTLLTPTFGNMYIDTMYFFVPNRLVWSHWKQFMGENTDSAWIPTTTYQVPQITAPSGGWNIGTLADYIGIPTGVSGISVNALPFRAYALICNEFFRDENLSDPLVIPVTDATVAGSNGSTFVSDVAKGGAPYTAAKYHDYFTSCLPAPQKGPDVTVPIGTVAPVFAGSTDNTSYTFPKNSGGNYIGLHLQQDDKAPTDVISTGTTYYGLAMNTADPAGGFNAKRGEAGTYSSAPGVYPINLYADLNQATAASINELRQAFQIQRFYEKLAQGGSRYTEILSSMFKVTSPDSRLQRPEYLGGTRQYLNIHQVIANSAATNQPLGDTAAMSVTSGIHHDFTKSFVEHGFVIGVAVVRYQHTYQQGINRMFSRKDRFDYYFPVFAHLGNSPVYNREIFAQGTSDDAEVFGYQEAWADYRYKPNTVTGQMRSAANNSLDIWHLADDYDTLPTLSDSWIREDKSNVDRILAVKSTTANQIFIDFFIDAKATRPMPLYSIPGLIDHY